MELVRTLGCPSCGGALVLGPGQRLVRCGYCNGLKLVALEDSVARYLARPLVDARAAESALKSGLGSTLLDRRLAHAARIRPPRLYYLPFYELQTRRAGRARIDKIKLVPKPHRSGSSSGSGDAGPPPSVVVSTPDTRVILASWTFHWPAVELPDWGLESLDPRLLRHTEGLCLERFDSQQIGREATAIEPALSPDGFRRAALRALPSQASDVRTLEESLEILYYPLWRASYVHRGRVYRASVDGIAGSLVRLHGPRSRTRGAAQSLALAAALGAGPALLVRFAASVLGRPVGLAEAAAGLALLGAALWAARRSVQSLLPAGDLVLERRQERLEAR